MLKKIRLKLNNGWVQAVGVFGVGLLPCPDCGLPLAAHVWPVAAVVWLYRRVRRRSLHKLDLLLTDDARTTLRTTPEPASAEAHPGNPQA
ncbi:MAG: hypothetical protein GYB65_05455 [Chloroflexi bacterium]|nr:hypothetical protein [Chloroflexota bacterium]